MAKKFIKFAYTRNIPVKNHPAQIRGTKGNKKVEFVVFTHAEEIDLDLNSNKPIEEHRRKSTIKLNHKIEQNPKDNRKSRVSPVVYVADRDKLGSNRTDYSLHKEDKKIVDNIFKNGQREKL
ncbi:MAG: hypothetical protein IJY57_04570 [Clostridia bacterium]|nr:hypothetical protein [Clostridia bacterium]